MSDSTTKRLAFAAAAILVVTGCTTESSSSGCSSVSGFTGSSKSELGEGSFSLSDDARTRAPAAVAKGGDFTLKYRRFSDEGTPLALRAASRDKLIGVGSEDAAAGVQFRALEPGNVAVLAVSTKDESQVVDLLHVRVLAPSQIRFAVPYDFIDEDIQRALAALEKGKISVPRGVGTTVLAQVVGEVDEANGALADQPVGSLVVLAGIVPTWETTDAEVIAVETNNDGTTYVRAAGVGAADVTVRAGDVSKVVHVSVTSGGSIR